MPQLVWLEGKHTTQTAHCALEKTRESGKWCSIKLWAESASLWLLFYSKNTRVCSAFDDCICFVWLLKTTKFHHCICAPRPRPWFGAPQWLPAIVLLD